MLQDKQRFLRLLPGRIRIEISGLMGNYQTAEIVRNRLASIKGIRRVLPCTVSGRALIEFDEKTVQSGTIIHAIQEMEMLLHAGCSKPESGETPAPAAGISLTAAKNTKSA